MYNDTGWYGCVVHNEQGMVAEYGYVEVVETLPTDESEQSAMPIVYVASGGGVIVVLLTVCIVVFCK